MRLKLIIIGLNTVYLIATVIWVIIDKSFEPIVAVIGGFVSFLSFFIANNNSFSVTYDGKKKQIVNNERNIIRKQNNVQGNYYENNK